MKLKIGIGMRKNIRSTVAQKLSSQLKERKKELKFQYELTNLVSNPKLKQHDVFEKVPSLLANAFQFPNHAVILMK